MVIINIVHADSFVIASRQRMDSIMPYLRSCEFQRIMRPLIAVLLVIFIAADGFSADRTPSLRAGAAAVDVTPKIFPISMPGGFTGKLAEKAHDPLYARALVLDDGLTQLAMVVVDNLGVSPEVVEEAKIIASKKTGIDPSKMMICSTHTHSGPPSNVTSGPAAAVAYRKQLIGGMADAISQAHAALKPASIGSASHPLPEEVFNRRWYLKPGKMPENPFGRLDTVKMNPGRSSEVLDKPAGPVDPDLAVISVHDQKNKPLALFANYSLHYVGGIPRGQMSADYFGEFARLMPNRLRANKDFVAMMSNGASGDINNIPFTVTRPPREPFEQIRIVARKAADTAWFAHQKIKKHDSNVRLGMMEREIELKYRRPTEAQVKAAKAVLAIKNEDEINSLPRLAQHYARKTVQAAEREHDTITVKIQAIRIGDLAVCGIPFETFVEIGLELKKRSPFSQTIVVGMANGKLGYLPTPEQHQLGGYETWLGTCIVQKDASVILNKNLFAMLNELKEIE